MGKRKGQQGTKQGQEREAKYNTILTVVTCKIPFWKTNRSHPLIQYERFIHFEDGDIRPVIPWERLIETKE